MEENKAEKSISASSTAEYDKPQTDLVRRSRSRRANKPLAKSAAEEEAAEKPEPLALRRTGLISSSSYATVYGPTGLEVGPEEEEAQQTESEPTMKSIGEQGGSEDR